MLNSETQCPLCNSPGKFCFLGRDLLYNKTEKYRYMRCSHCEAVYQDPMPNADEISQFYPDDYGPYEQLESVKNPSHLKLSVLNTRYGYDHLDVPRGYRLVSPVFAAFRYRDSIQFIPNGKGLDIGCGNGQFIRSMNSLGWDFQGVEFNSTAVKACRAIGLKVFRGNLNDADFDDNSFDLITSRHVIEHIPAPDGFMNEIFRILKKGGRLVIETPNSRALGRKWFKENWFADDVPRHLILYSPANINMLTKRHGFQMISMRLFTSPKIILNSWDYLTKNRGKPSKRRKYRRIFAKLYVVTASLCHRGDTIFAIYEKS